MQAIQLSLMQALIKIVTPASPAYGNTVAFERLETYQELQAKLQPGDVIFSRTDSTLYEIGRKYMGINYDHVAVVINSKEVIHISPPIISKIDMALIVHPSREPMIIRPKVEDLDRFLTVLHNFLGEKYNSSALAVIALKQLSSKLQKPSKIMFSLSNIKYSRICSDAVLYSLCRASPKISENVETQIKKTRFEQLGFFMPDQVADILLSNGSELILKTNFKQEYPILTKLSSASEKLFDFAFKIGRFTAKGAQNLALKMLKPKPKAQNQAPKPQKKPQSKSLRPSNMDYVHLTAVMMALGQTLGVTVNNKFRYIMLLLNMAMVIGHFQDIKAHLEGHPKL